MSRSNNSATARPNSDVMKKEVKEKEDAAPSPPPEKVFYDNRIKRKNVLALNEKVAAIREYEKVPVYKRIGRMFHCSPDQIKRIVQQKDEILKAWEQRTRRCQDAKTLEMKVVRVSMLGKAVYDWIRRMMYYKDFMITDGLIQKMALQFKSAMSLPNFFPHKDWCDKFRQTYKITKHDSKQLKIGYTQGHSVQIKDVMKDVLSECTPDVIGNKQKDENDNERDDGGDESNDKTKLNKTKKSTNSAAETTTQKPPLPQLQPMRQLMTLPIQTNGVRMSQKVLVATPINAAGQRPGTSPMTMTIIPLATIGQCKQNAQAPKPIVTVPKNTAKKSNVPPPMVEIKKEIKEEPEEFKIKEEYISDDDDDIIDTTCTQESAHEEQQQQQQAAATASSGSSSPTRPNSLTSTIPTTAKEMDAVDYEDLALSSLRKIMQNKTKDAPAAAAIVTTARTPPLPPLTRAPTNQPHIINRTANKRKLPDDTPALPAIKTCTEARRYLKLLEDFALVKENFRLIGLVTRADEVLRELDGDDDVDID